jgi:uncharacterized membrane protein YcaP (DUF421 family)
MEIITEWFGQGKELNALQMGFRALVVFLVALILIRLSGRRSFGIRTPMDNIIVILLGAVLSRAVVGASPFVPVLSTCGIIVLLHRFFGWLVVHSDHFGKLVEGEKFLLYADGHFIRENLNKALVCKEDVMQGIRKSALTENLHDIDKVYMERNGEISAIRKKIS